MSNGLYTKICLIGYELMHLFKKNLI